MVKSDQLLEQPRLQLDVAPHHREHRPRLGKARVLLHLADAKQNGHQRRAQLMREHREEAVFRQRGQRALRLAPLKLDALPRRGGPIGPQAEDHARGRAIAQFAQGRLDHAIGAVAGPVVELSRGVLLDSLGHIEECGMDRRQILVADESKMLVPTNSSGS